MTYVNYFILNCICEQGGGGFARRITFENIKFVRAHNPIWIDQFYCVNQMVCKNMVTQDNASIPFFLFMLLPKK